MGSRRDKPGIEQSRGTMLMVMDTQTKPVEAKPTGHAMDVLPPRLAEAPKVREPEAPLAQAPTPLPVPNPANPIDSGGNDNEPHPGKHAQKPARPVTSHRSSGAGLAIFATIVVVLGLGAMMVYAYLRTNGVAAL